MNGAHWHLVLNHLPIIFPICGLLIMVVGLFFKSAVIRRVAYFIFIVGAITAIAAFSTGEGAEEVVERVQGINEQTIEIHENTAKNFSIFIYLLGGISLIGLWANWAKKSISKVITGLTIVLTLIVLFFAQQTGTTGGEIIHTEIRTNKKISNHSIHHYKEYEEEEEDDD